MLKYKGIFKLVLGLVNILFAYIMLDIQLPAHISDLHFTHWTLISSVKRLLGEIIMTASPVSFLTMLAQVGLQWRRVSREAFDGVWVCPLWQARLGLGGFLHWQTSHLHAVYIQSSWGQREMLLHNPARTTFPHSKSNAETTHRESRGCRC